MTTFSFFLVAMATLTVVYSQQQDALVRVPTLGVLRGKVKNTTGNSEHPPTEFYSFRNIPFAESVSGDRRFSQPVQLRTELGTEAAPYDATRAGPLCPQSGRSPEAMAAINNQIIDDIVQDVLEQNNLDGLIDTSAVVRLLEELLDTPLAGVTFADALLALADIELSVDEDCLHLAVSTPVLPTNQTDQLLPVMVFIYGGGYYAGTQMKMNYDRLGSALDTPVVLVAINYRVGTFGFMCLDTDSAAGNMGLLDQIVALEWVQENIQFFGGDPSQVTIFGESAGAASVSFLTLSPLAEGLFSRAIGESGSAVAPWAYDDVTAEYHTRNIAAKVNCTQEDLEQLVDCLKQLSFADLSQADKEYLMDQRLGGGTGFEGHLPCGQTKGERKVLVHGQDPMDILISGSYNPVPMMFGANLDEGLLPYLIADTLTLNDSIKNDQDWLTNESVMFVLEFCGYNATEEQANQIRDEYFTPEQLGDYLAMIPGLIDLTGVLFLKEPSYVVIENNFHRADSFFYSLESRSSKSFYNTLINKAPDATPVEGLDGVGYCSHGDDLQFLFNIELPLILCDIRDFFTGLVNAYLQCVITQPGNAFDCVTRPDSNFRNKYGQCLHAELSPEELMASEAMVKAFTNFAHYGNPTPPGSGLPLLEPWTPQNPGYIVFDSSLVEIRQDYRLSYHSTPQS